MRFSKGWTLVLCLLVAALFVATTFAQETTGGLQGTIKDPSGAVVPSVTVTVTSPVLIGVKSMTTDSSGYFRFSNLPPGSYTITTSAKGFSTLKRDDVVIQVGHLPSIDLVLQVGATEQVVEVTSEAPVIDVTTNHTLTNITAAVVADIPHGRSYQSVIQFAPAARNEPLAGSAITNQSAGGTGTGGNSPGNGGNGQTYGFSIGGGADSENSYLVEGQNTASPIGGYQHTNVPFEFIQEVQVKSSGVEAEYGGALGGVVNVVMKKGTNNWHGTVGLQWEPSTFDGSPAAYVRYDPAGTQYVPTGWSLGRKTDFPVQTYQPKKDKTQDLLPSFSLGGALVKDRLFTFISFAPEYFTNTRTVDFAGTGSIAANRSYGKQLFDRDIIYYYGNGRLDYRAFSKLNLFASWLYQYERVTGNARPGADPVNSALANASITSPLTNFARGVGFVAPNSTYNFGADFTVSPSLVATTRFGYFFENYHDFGYPNGTIFTWGASGLGQNSGYQSALINGNYTTKNADKTYQLSQDLAWFKSGWLGTQNFKFGYQFTRASNVINQTSNGPQVRVLPGTTSGNYNGTLGPGTLGQLEVFDSGTGGDVYSVNHSFYAQDSWTLGKGITINGGVRFEHENLPLSSFAIQSGDYPLKFGWGAKIAPRIGAAWDVFKNGKLKMYGSYGQFVDQMKLNLAISSFGGQWWNSCFYQLNNANVMGLVSVAPGSDGRYCSGSDSSVPALGNYYTTATPGNGVANVFDQNVNYREVIPGLSPWIKDLKPYRQHESVFGAAFQISKDLALDAGWSRRRLDHAVEDTAIEILDNNEIWQVVNPGEGENAIAACPTCPMNIKPERSYDGVELRLTKAQSHNWGGMFSYTWSRLYGNYAGLTNTDQTDGGGGRNSPNNSRAFDEPYFQFNAYGTSSSGLLATDRPNTFKGYVSYKLKEGGRATSTFGLFQTAYQGTPFSTYIDVGGGGGGYGIYPEGRGKWADITQDPATGMLTVNGVRSRRTPWYNQSDLSFSQEFKTSKNNERQALTFEATIGNLLNQHSALVYGNQVNARTGSRYLLPGGRYLYGDDTLASYNAFEHPYDWKTLLNTNTANDAGLVNAPRPIIFNNQYGQPLAWQQSRTIRLALRYTF